MAGLLRDVTHNSYQIFDYVKWLELEGPEELAQREYQGTRLNKDEEVQAVLNLEQGTRYIDNGYGEIEFRGEVRVFPSGAAQFKFKRSWGRSAWLGTNEVANLKHKDGSSIVFG